MSAFLTVVLLTLAAALGLFTTSVYADIIFQGCGATVATYNQYYGYGNKWSFATVTVSGSADRSQFSAFGSLDPQRPSVPVTTIYYVDAY